MEKIDCMECKEQHVCCESGAWVDLEEAKKILSLGLKGEFVQLEKDESFPSGYKIGTSYNDNRCTFLATDGLCTVHTVNYDLKPTQCKEFPYENGELAEFADLLCPMVKSKIEAEKKL